MGVGGLAYGVPLDVMDGWEKVGWWTDGVDSSLVLMFFGFVIIWGLICRKK